MFLEKERAQVTLGSIGDAVVSTDCAGNVTYLNPVAESMTGWSQQDASGRPLMDVLRIVDADNREPALNPLELAILQDKTVGLSATVSWSAATDLRPPLKTPRHPYTTGADR
jgi:PAS domain-containing protein